MAMKSRTYCVNVNGLTTEATEQVRSWLQHLFNEKVNLTADGLLCVEWSAYKAGHDEMAPRVRGVNMGIAIALGRYGQPTQL